LAYRHLNDPTELRFGVDLAHQALLQAQQGADGRVGLFHRMSIDLFSHENLENLGFFVGSFTRARDDLAQWIAYADNGRGVAIGYTPQMFEIVDGVKAAPEENAFLGPVVYDPVGALSRHRTAVDAAAAIFLETAAANAELLRDKAIGIPFMRIFSLRLIASALIWNALTTKHPGYKREQEVRLVVMGTVNALAPAVQARQRNDKAIPFIAHPWPARGPGQIAEILIGPAMQEVDEREIRQFLVNQGVTDVPIIRSDIPYRS